VDGRRVRIGLGVIAVCLALLVTVLVVQRMNPDRFSGDPDDIASVKTAVPELVQGDRAIGALPDDASKLTTAVQHSEQSRVRRARLAREVWTRQSAARHLKSWSRYVDDMIEARQLYGFDGKLLYDETRFEVTKWLGVTVRGTKAVVDVRARDRYRYLGGLGWDKGQELHWRFTLWRLSSTSDRWYLEDEEGDVDFENHAMGLTVGGGD
jgi:hypothetical protein